MSVIELDLSHPGPPPGGPRPTDVWRYRWELTLTRRDADGAASAEER